MSTVLAGMWVMATFIISALVLSLGIVGSGLVQGRTLQDVSVLQGEQMRTALGIASVGSSDSGGVTAVTLGVDNTGSTTIVQMKEMDLFVKYTDVNDNAITMFFTYVTTGPGNNQWLRSALAPDSYNPALWDPGEQATLQANVSPAIKVNSVATIVVSTPNGVTTSKSWTHTG